MIIDCILTFSHEELAAQRIREVNNFWPTIPEGAFAEVHVSRCPLWFAAVRPFYVDAFITHLIRRVHWEYPGLLQFWWKPAERESFQVFSAAPSHHDHSPFMDGQLVFSAKGTHRPVPSNN